MKLNVPIFNVLANCFLLLIAVPSVMADSTSQGNPAIKISLTHNSVYELAILRLDKNNAMTVKTDADGKVSVRAILTLHLLRIPDCYDTRKLIGSALPSNGSNGVIGKGFDKEPDLPSSAYDQTTGEILSPAPKGSTYELNDILFNAIRTFMPRSEQSDENGTSLLALAVDPNKGVANKIVSSDYAFSFADSLSNARNARSLAFLGQDAVHTEKFSDYFKSNKDINVFTDPQDIDGTKPASDALNETNLRNDGRWYFDEYEVSDSSRPSMPSMPMMDVRVEWAVEADFDPANPPSLPLGSISSASPSASDASKPDQTAPASVQSAPAQGIFGALGITGAQISGLGTPVQAPGLDIVGGFAIRDNGTPTMLGANVSVVTRGKSEDPGTFIDLRRLGALIGRTTDSEGAYITALSFKMNPSSIFYIGPSFSNSNGITRSSIAFGAAFNLLNLLSGSNAPAPASKADKSYDVSYDPGKLDPVACSKDSQAAILWTTPKPKDKSSSFNLETLTPIYTQDSTGTYSGLFTFKQKTGDRYYWLQVVNPGTLTNVTGTTEQTVKAQDVVTEYDLAPLAQKSQLYLFKANSTSSRADMTSTEIKYDKDQLLQLSAGNVYVIQASTSSSYALADSSNNPQATSAPAGVATPPGTPGDAAMPPALTETPPAPTPPAPAPALAPALAPAPPPATPAPTPTITGASPITDDVVVSVPASMTIQAADTGLNGIVSSFPGLCLSDVQLQLWDVTDTKFLTTTTLSYVAGSKPDRFNWQVRPGTYHLRAIDSSKADQILCNIVVSTGSSFWLVDLNRPSKH